MPVHSEGPTLLRIVHQAADAAAIDLVLMWGSLLGHVRDGGIIAHDYDIDLNMFSRDIPKVEGFIRLLQRVGLEVDVRSPYQITVTQPNGRVFGIDVWVFYEHSDDVLLYSFRRGGGLFRYELPKRLFDDTEVVDFLGTPCRIPRDARTVLGLAYGDWHVRRPDFSDDDAPCATVCGDYPQPAHSLGAHVQYSRWGRPLGVWPPYSVIDVGFRIPDLPMLRSTGRTCTLDDFAGKHLLLCFFGSLTAELSRNAVGHIDGYVRQTRRTDVAALCVSADRRDRRTPQAAGLHGNLMLICDDDRVMCRAFGALPNLTRDDIRQDFRLFLMLVSPQRRVLQVFRMADYRDAVSALDGLRPAESFLGFEAPPPLTFFPELLGADLCERLIEEFESQDRDGAFDRPGDAASAMDAVSARIEAVVVAELDRVFALKARWPSDPVVTRFDRRNPDRKAVRDNADPSQAHRRYKVVINLNDTFAGGEDRFPEYSFKLYPMRRGTGVLFPCAIAHEMTPVISGDRYACVCYLTDDEGMRSRSAYVRAIAISR